MLKFLIPYQEHENANFLLIIFEALACETVISKCGILCIFHDKKNMPDCNLFNVIGTLF